MDDQISKAQQPGSCAVSHRRAWTTPAVLRNGSTSLHSFLASFLVSCRTSSAIVHRHLPTQGRKFRGSCIRSRASTCRGDVWRLPCSSYMFRARTGAAIKTRRRASLTTIRPRPSYDKARYPPKTRLILKIVKLRPGPSPRPASCAPYKAEAHGDVPSKLIALDTLSSTTLSYCILLRGCPCISPSYYLDGRPNTGDRP
ncbi:hypothetical protein BD626DRAFT_515351 [Schizophyllum amplum]|uniref:Uncharacterized protein n=1 Tax=Schizophyllum amplum TaxID=97359 RepID=A0A550BXQ5_9AGAR|nr:hypothetical protein BD626DRAFT_515351 [Auriculariopsis ampla]